MFPYSDVSFIEMCIGLVVSSTMQRKRSRTIEQVKKLQTGVADFILLYQKFVLVCFEKLHFYEIQNLVSHIMQ